MPFKISEQVGLHTLSRVLTF